MLKLEYINGHVSVRIKTNEGLPRVAYELTMCIKALIEAMDDPEDKEVLKIYIDGPMAKVILADSIKNVADALLKDLEERFGDETKHKQD